MEENQTGPAGYAEQFDAMAEQIRQEGSENEDLVQRKILWGVAAGSEVWYRCLRSRSRR